MPLRDNGDIDATLNRRRDKTTLWRHIGGMNNDYIAVANLPPSARCTAAAAVDNILRYEDMGLQTSWKNYAMDKLFP